MSKSSIACQFNLENLLEGTCTFWTLTFDPNYDGGDMGSNHDFAADQWDGFLREVRRKKPKLAGVRVFETHKSNRLHIHVVFNQWIPLHWLKAIATAYGFGHIDCQGIHKSTNQGLPGYLTKYLQKEQKSRHGRFRKGRRLWATFGKLVTKVLVKSIQCDCPTSRFFKWWFRAPLHVAQYFYARIMPWSFSKTEGQTLPLYSVPKLKTHADRWRWGQKLNSPFSIWWNVEGKNKNSFLGLDKAMSTPAWDQ